MKIRELFEHDVTRDIPPVVYFHEQSPKKLESEVSEYIITGGYPEGSPQSKRLKHGIHEQLVHFCRALHAERTKPGGPELPASWISGFYGSGKSSFAKLLGLALDGKTLPNGTPLAEALLRRDDSPLAHELREAWTTMRGPIDPIAVVFDIGGVARDDEHIPSAIVRQLQVRLDYCSTSNLVADHELKLERDEEWPEFLTAAQTTLERPWSEAKGRQQADDDFSHVMHVLRPDRFPEPTTWLDSRAGQQTGIGTSAEEAVKAIEAMLAVRAPGKTLFLVVDEVSQYVHQDQSRMLKLQSFVSALGTRLKGAAWLLATGQEKLEEASEATPIGKLKERFPARLRVHLAATNIRDVVHRRLLKKAQGKEAVLRALFEEHRSDLKLHGFKCEEITEEDFLEVYPMLPGHVDLLLQITSALRTRSTRIQGDDHAIRGLLQLLGELFRGGGTPHLGREQALADRDVGELVTLDAIYEVQHTALDSDVQATLGRIHAEVGRDTLQGRVAKAVALLELLQDTMPTTPKLVASCLYDRLGRGSQEQAVGEALEALRERNLCGYTEKQGYKIQSSAGQDWQRDRDDVGVTPEQVSELVQKKLGELLVGAERAKLRGRPFAWTAFYSDGRQASDVRFSQGRDDATVTLDFRFVNAEERRSPAWVKRSGEEALRDRVVWVVGDHGTVDGLARELCKSRRMITRNDGIRATLVREKQRLLIEEEARAEDLDKKLEAAIGAAFVDGTIYFRGRSIQPRDHGAAFASAATGIGNRVLPELYPHFVEIAISEGELAQLLEPTLSGPSTKFLEAGLGVLSLDAGKYVATCSGQVPSRILAFIEKNKGSAGGTLLSTFARPPYGYPADVVKACLVGLVRGGKIHVRPQSGAKITSVRDPGAKDFFRSDRELRHADLFPAGDTGITGRDRIAIGNLFKDYLGVDIDRDDDPIANAVYDHLAPQRERLREVETKLERLPGRPPTPPALEKLVRALEACQRSRHVAPTVAAVKEHLDTLRDGLQLLNVLRVELTDAAIDAVRDAASARDHELVQLEAVGDAGDLAAEAKALRDQLAAERPWRDLGSIEAAVKTVREAYKAARLSLLGQQQQAAEAARARIRGRAGFERLDADASHHVLRPITEAMIDTTADAIAPPLVDLRDRFPVRLHQAEDGAPDRLDDKLADLEVKPERVVRVALSLKNRDVRTREELRLLLAEIEQRVGAQLDQGARVRIV